MTTTKTTPDPVVVDDELVVSQATTPVRTPRERIDVVLRFCEADDPFVVDWAPPQS
jgi:hypothetical protein